MAILIICVAVGSLIIKKMKPKNNPTIPIYILYALIVLLVIMGFIVYLYYTSGSNNIVDEAHMFKQYIDKKCFEPIEVNNSLSVMDNYVHKQLRFYGVLWKVIFWVTIVFLILVIALIIYKIKNYG